MLRIILISLAALALATVAVMGVRGTRSARAPLQMFDDMVDQARYRNQGQSALFADGRQMRTEPAGAVAWGRKRDRAEEAYAVADAELLAATTIPAKLDRALLERGQLQFNTYCAACHGGSGAGDGITTKYSMTNPPTYHSDRLRQASPGYIYEVITNGRGLMGAVGDRLHREDRWSIVAYVRALQRANNATLGDLPAAHRGEVQP